MYFKLSCTLTFQSVQIIKMWDSFRVIFLFPPLSLPHIHLLLFDTCTYCFSQHKSSHLFMYLLITNSTQQPTPSPPHSHFSVHFLHGCTQSSPWLCTQPRIMLNHSLPLLLPFLPFPPSPPCLCIILAPLESGSYKYLCFDL